ncbi:MAG: 6-phosphogluconolactonase [bacterium]
MSALMEAVAGLANPVVGLPTGNTPVALYEDLRARVLRNEVDISNWVPFAIDEYGGLRDHPCSNRRFFARYWDTIPGAPPVEQFDPETSDLPGDIRRMSLALERAGGLDVSVLGIGMNGHLAFNEPGSMLDSTVRRVDLQEASRLSGGLCWGAAVPTWGLTLGLKELLGASTVVVMANGVAKADVVAKAIGGPETPECPASLVRRAPRPIWVLDDVAAAGVGKSG